MPVAFTFDPRIPPGIQSGGSYYEIFGTLTFTGSYPTGGDQVTLNGVNTDFEKIMKRIGAGFVFWVDITRGLTAEWMTATKLLKMYTTAYTEVAAAAYNAALTASPVPVRITGR